MPPRIIPEETPPEGKHCPHCHEIIDYMDWRASQTCWGSAYGIVDMDGNEEENDSSVDESENNDYEYTCPRCNHDLDSDFFDTDDEEEENEETEEELPETIKPDSEGEEIAGTIDPSLYTHESPNKSFVEFMKTCGYAEADDESSLEELKKLYPTIYKDFQTLYN